MAPEHRGSDHPLVASALADLHLRPASDETKGLDVQNSCTVSLPDSCAAVQHLQIPDCGTDPKSRGVRSSLRLLSHFAHFDSFRRWLDNYAKFETYENLLIEANDFKKQLMNVRPQ